MKTDKSFSFLTSEPDGGGNNSSLMIRFKGRFSSNFPEFFLSCLEILGSVMSFNAYFIVVDRSCRLGVAKLRFSWILFRRFFNESSRGTLDWPDRRIRCVLLSCWFSVVGWSTVDEDLPTAMSECGFSCCFRRHVWPAQTHRLLKLG